MVQFHSKFNITKIQHTFTNAEQWPCDLMYDNTSSLLILLKSGLELGSRAFIKSIRSPTPFRSCTTNMSVSYKVKRHQNITATCHLKLKEKLPKIIHSEAHDTNYPFRFGHWFIIRHIDHQIAPLCRTYVSRRRRLLLFPWSSSASRSLGQ